MIRITDSVFLDPRDLKETFVRSSGPGGQNVNKVATCVELRFDTVAADLPAYIKMRLPEVAGSRLTAEGILIITAQSFRSQERNREDALSRLVALLKKAAHRPKKRLATRPTKASKIRRLEAKTRRSDVKSRRQSKPRFDD
jgi:ribosome-associated protein